MMAEMSSDFNLRYGIVPKSTPTGTMPLSVVLWRATRVILHDLDWERCWLIASPPPVLSLYNGPVCFDSSGQNEIVIGTD